MLRSCGKEKVTTSHFLVVSKKRKDPAGTGSFQKLAITFSTKLPKTGRTTSCSVKNILTNKRHFVKMFFCVSLRSGELGSILKTPN